MQDWKSFAQLLAEIMAGHHRPQKIKRGRGQAVGVAADMGSGFETILAGRVWVS
jgi:hypothetical protein